MRTQGWWLNVAKRVKNPAGHSPFKYVHYCSIWLGDNRVGDEEKMKAVHISTLFPAPDYKVTLSEEWISGKDHEI